MADFKITSSADTADDLESQRLEELATRKEMRIETLADDEELIGDTLFSSMHEDLASSPNTSDAENDSEGDPKDSTEDGLEIDELLLEDVIWEIPADRAVEEGSFDQIELAPNSPGEVALVEAELQGAVDRDGVARVALRLGRRFAHVVALFVVNKGVIAGIRGGGEGLEERIEGVMISSSLDGVFAQAANTAKSCRTRAPYDEAMDRRVMSALGRGDAHELLVVPIIIRGRVVSLLYADNGHDPIPVTSVAGLRALALCVAQAYERLIMSRKQPRT